MPFRNRTTKEVALISITFTLCIIAISGGVTFFVSMALGHVSVPAETTAGFWAIVQYGVFPLILALITYFTFRIKQQTEHTSQLTEQNADKIASVERKTDKLLNGGGAAIAELAADRTIQKMAENSVQPDAIPGGDRSYDPPGNGDTVKLPRLNGED